MLTYLQVLLIFVVPPLLVLASLCLSILQLPDLIKMAALSTMAFLYSTPWLLPLQISSITLFFLRHVFEKCECAVCASVVVCVRERERERERENGECAWRFVV